MSTIQQPAPAIVLRLPEVLRRIGVSRSTLYAWIKGGHFPSPIKLGGSQHSASGWLESAVNQWLQQRIHATSKTTGNPLVGL